jgi:Carboxypeptidase regulatory-like domain
MTLHSEDRVSSGRVIATLFALLVLITTALHAQVYSGSLTGLVTDPSGAAVPKATAVLTDEEKGFTTTGKTDTEGRFVLRNLAPGRYKLVVSARACALTRRRASRST